MASFSAETIYRSQLWEKSTGRDCGTSAPRAAHFLAIFIKCDVPSGLRQCCGGLVGVLMYISTLCHID